jgi:hypothetical protein
LETGAVQAKGLESKMTMLSNISRKGLVGGIAAATLATSLAAFTPTTASAGGWGNRGWHGGGGGWHGGYRRGGGWGGPGLVGGLALGALAAGAAGAYAYNGYPAYGYGGCYLTRQRVWDGWGYSWRNVRVCD